MKVFILTEFENIAYEHNDSLVGVFATREEAKAAGDRYIKVSNKMAWDSETSKEEAKKIFTLLVINECTVGNDSVVVEAEEEEAKFQKAMNDISFEAMH